jgi:serine/threonine-protein kinase
MSMRHASADALPEGTVLDDRFEIEERLGAGAFGAVYRARQLIFGHPWREVALKIFASDKVNVENAREIFNDAIMLSRLQEENPNPEVARHLIQVFDIGIVKTPEPRAYVSMKLVRTRRTLEHAVLRWHEAGGMPVKTALEFLRQLLVPLAWMHTLGDGVAHGDLKPDNVLMVADTELVLSDFGLAAKMPLGSFGGAISYQPHETLVGDPILPQSDIFGVGLILYEMLTGRHAFAGVGLEALAANDTKAYVEAHRLARRWEIRGELHGDPPGGGRIRPPAEFNREVAEHPHVEAMLAKCLGQFPSQRYANARLMLTDLDGYLTEGPAARIEGPKPATVASAAFQKDDAASLTGKSRSLLDQGRAAEALEKAKAAVALDPRHVPAMLAQALAHHALKQSGEAIAVCQQAQKLAPQTPEVFDTLAVLNPAAAATFRDRAKYLRETSRRR